MKPLGCQKSECTVAQTSLCLLDYVLEDCPNVLVKSDTSDESRLDEQTTEDNQIKNKTPIRFPPSTAIGTVEAEMMMKNEYHHMIGLLGIPDAGKTACLVSLYLLMSHDRLKGFRFADSKSLLALDELSRGARRWERGCPEQMTTHTELGDGRSASFVHFKVVRTSDGVSFNVLMPDLPGEWSESLIDNNRSERLHFLRSTESIWIMVDGQQLVEKERRLGATHRTKLLIDRVVELCRPHVPHLHLVVSRADLGIPDDRAINEIIDRITNQEIDFSITNIASFSKNEKVPPGTGIAELLAQSFSSNSPPREFWPDTCDCDQSATRRSLRIDLGART